MRPTFRDMRSPILVLLLSLLMTGAVTAVVAQNVDAQNRAQFHRRADSMRDAIDRRMAAYLNSLLGARGLFLASSDAVSPLEWRRYVTSLDLRERYPGIQGVGFADGLTPGEVSPAEARLRRTLVPDFTVRPAGRRPFYAPVTYLEPMDRRNRAALGFDMFSDPNRRAAMERARDTGLPAMTEPVTLVQEITADKQPGFLIYVPVYRGDEPTSVDARRAALEGFVYAPFRAHDLFAGVFADRAQAQLGFSVFDGPATSSDTLLYRGPNGRGPAMLETTRPIAVAGHTWTLVVQAPRNFAFDAPSRLPLYMALVGLLISLLLFTNAWVLATGRHRAQTMAEGMTAELRQADRAKDEFLSVISHELRTPLNFIMGFASILDDELPGPLNPKQREYMGKIMNGADRMLMLVNDLLDFAKLQAGKFQLSPDLVAYPAVLHEAIAAMRPLAAQKGLTLESEIRTDDTVCMDGERVSQVLYNLISNAIKFTPEGGSIRVVARREGDHLVTAVSDTGIGIAPEDVPKLFTRFKQLDMSATRQAGGTGLGLSIAKALVEAHGGTIRVESAPDRGSTFSFTLPVDSPLADCRPEPGA
ncbi:MAG: CHASE domain-containing protein [Candidatus Sericytochromatia bacterium]